jgi:hypothetical protein
MSQLPLQPLYLDVHGTVRFRENKVVAFLYHWGQERGMGLNELAQIDFPREDREQFAQLIGYSLGGFADLSYVSDETYQRAEAEAEKL